MGFWTHQPSADWRNDGWSLVGSGVTQAWQCLSGDDDTKYVKCPASKGACTVSFPVDIDTSAVPDGAVITSITVYLRCSTGTGTASLPSGTPASITVSTSCQDDTSRYTTRTIYPNTNGSIATFEIATYKADALGFDWDIERLNHLLCRIFCYVGIFDLIRCYKFYCVINYRVRPTVVVTAPTGSVQTPSPVISWTYSQTDGDPQAKAEYKLFTAVQQADVSFNPETSPPVFYAKVSGDISSVTLPTSIDPDSYWVYVRVYSSFSAKSVWVGRQFSVQGPSPGVPGVPDPTGIAAPGTGVITVVPDDVAGSVSLTLRDTSNMLGVQAADFETTTDGQSYSTTNCTIAQDSSTAFPGGSNSLKMTSSSAADMTATTDWVEVDQGIEITGTAQFKTAVTARGCRVRILFYDAAFNALSGTIAGATATDSTSTWTAATATGKTPTGAVYARLALDILAPANAEVHSVDQVGLLYGTLTPWSDGGHMSRNLLSHWYATAEDPAQSGQSWTAGTATTTTVATSPGGAGASGNKTHQMKYVGLSPTLGFRATGTTFTSPTSGTDYTLNKPVGTASGDLMVAFVSSSKSGTITPPAGWTAVNTASISIDGTADTALFILKRTAGAAEPTSWTDGSVSQASVRRCAVVVSYSGAADASQQFLAEGAASTSNNLPLWLSSPTISNTDPNAWRISAFAFNDNATGGTMVANVNPPSTIPAIQFVGRASAWKDTASSTSYTINKPSGVISGDLMIATVGVQGNVTISTPTGWTLVRQTVATSGPYTQAIFKRTAGASEAASWTASVSGTIGHTKVTQAVAYRNCDLDSNQFISEAGSSTGAGNTIATGTVTNTNSLSWRVAAFGANTSTNAPSWGDNEVIDRCDDSSTHSVQTGWFSYTYDSTVVTMADSNGSVGTGSYAKSGSLSTNFFGAAAWIGILKPTGSPPSPVANETQRAQANVGSANPWLATGVFDSNGPVSAGNKTVTGIFTPGSGTDKSSASAWIGLIKPATPTRNGYALATMASKVDISSVDSSILDLAGNQVTATATFLGTTAGTPYLTVNFYRANVLLNTLVAQGSTFNTGTWVKSAATFDVPSGTTRMNLGVSASDRNVNDIVYFDRVGLSLGSAPVWRAGTGRSTHPMWAVPHIQYADDDGSGYTPWTDLPGQSANPPSYDPLTGLSSYVDHTIIPLTNRKYRARTVSYGLAGDQFVSSFGPESPEANFVAENWWLKDISNQSNNLALKVQWTDMDITTTNTATVFQPLGEDLPVVLSEGFKGDQFKVAMVPVNHADWVQLRVLLKSGKTLFLQSDVDLAWWVRPVGDLDSTVLASNDRKANPLRNIVVTFVQVEAEG